jgi:uncharacterized protein (DUF1697 family)
MQTFVAFQLGINLGKRTVKMAELKTAMEEAGYKNVRTLLASGNVVFEASEQDDASLTKKLDALMTEKFGFEIKNIVRSMEEITDLIKQDPFKGITLTPMTRFYVTFLSEPKEPSFRIPYETPEKDYKILMVSNKEVISYLILSEGRRTPDAMMMLAKEFGRNITTRNWNTVRKIAALAGNSQ